MLADTKYFILRSQDILVPTTNNLEQRRGTAKFSSESEQIEIESTKLTLSERNDLCHDPQTMEIAPAFPFKLINLVEIKDLETFTTASTRDVDYLFGIHQR